MGTEKVQTQIRRDQIAQAVLLLIGRKGLKGLSVAGVAAEIGLVPSALYRHFRGKEEMVDAALEIIGRRLLDNAEAVCRETGHALERLRLLLKRHLLLIRETQAIPRLLFSEDGFGDHPERKEKVYRFIKAFLARVAGMVRAGQKSGQIRRDFPAPTVAILFLGLFQPAAVLAYLSDGAYDVDRQVHRVWPLFQEAIENSPTRQ